MEEHKAEFFVSHSLTYISFHSCIVLTLALYRRKNIQIWKYILFSEAKRYTNIRDSEEKQKPSSFNVDKNVYSCDIDLILYDLIDVLGVVRIKCHWVKLRLFVTHLNIDYIKIQWNFAASSVSIYALYIYLCISTLLND